MFKSKRIENYWVSGGKIGGRYVKPTTVRSKAEADELVASRNRAAKKLK